MAVDITINETIDLVDITVNPNIIEVNVTRTSGVGGNQTLAQTLVLGNSTGGENILVNNADAIQLENGSKLSEGLYDEGTFGNKGIARTCAVGYEDKWEAGEQYITETTSGIIQFRRFAFNVPTVDDDTTKRYAVGSYWQMRNNDIYICTDLTEGAAVWEIYSVGGIPTLQEVLDNNHDLVDNNFFAGTGAGVDNSATDVNALGNGAAEGNSKDNVNAFGQLAASNNSGGNVNAFGSFAGEINTFNNVNLFGNQAQADEDGQTVLSKDGTIMARISTTELTNSRKYTLQDGDGTIAFLSDITGTTPTLQEVTDEGNTITTDFSVITLGEDNVAVASVFFPGQGASIATSGVLVNGFNSQSQYQAQGIIYADEVTEKNLSIEYPDSIVSTNKTQTFQDASGTIALTSDIPTTTSQLTNDGADGVNPFITLADIPVGAEASTLVREVKNMTGATLTKGTVVFISGANGNKALVQKAIATTDALSARTFGLLQSDILNNGLGNCVIIGDLSGINTSAFAEGVQLYLSGVTAGAFTDVRTLAPTHLVYIGKVTRSHPTQGQIEVQIQNGYELEEIHDVQIVTPLNNQTILYETSSKLWKNKTIIEDSITNGVTDIAPSQNAVFDALDLTRRLITNGTGSVTGTTAETILTSLTIPANTLDSKCFIWSTMDYFKTSSGACNLKLYINSSNSLSGATLVGLVVFGSNRNGSFNRKFYLNGTTLDLLLTNTAISQINNEFIEGVFGASTTLTVNPAANIFLIYTTQNDAFSTTATSKQATVQKMKLN